MKVVQMGEFFAALMAGPKNRDAVPLRLRQEVQAVLRRGGGELSPGGLMPYGDEALNRREHSCCMNAENNR
jgi:hypothetical protein